MEFLVVTRKVTYWIGSMCCTLYFIWRLQATAESTLADIKEKSATGLQHAIQQQSVLDLSVDLQAPYIIIPHGGLYSGYVACFTWFM
jgi:hypothetical protein